MPLDWMLRTLVRKNKLGGKYIAHLSVIGEWKLSLEASDMIARTLRQVVDSWTDPVLIKQMSDGERLCKLDDTQ